MHVFIENFLVYLFVSYFQDVTLAKHTEIRKFWEKAPISVDFKVFIFNVTNYWEVQNGSKPVVQEIGPFVFK